MGKTTRTTISVPAELKARMDAVQEEVNWSAVACRAFEAKLAEIISRKGARDMKDVIDRLRASKRKMEDDQYNFGFKFGQLWAQQGAEADELTCLANCQEALRPDEWELTWSDAGSSAYSCGESFVMTINPNAGRAEASEFWEQWGGDNHKKDSYDPDFVRGFAEGALEVWDEVKDQL